MPAVIFIAGKSVFQKLRSTNTMVDPSLIDPQAIESLRALNSGDDDEFLREIIGIFLEDTPQRITELEHALSAGDGKKFTRAAHSIKGSSSNLGVVALRAAAEKLEHLAQTQGLGEVAPLVAEVKYEFNRARVELDKLARK